MTAAKQHPKLRCVTFSLAFSLMGINILDIREIIPKVKITIVPHAPKFISGLMNLRGQIYTILDVGILLGFEKRHIRDGSHVIIFKHKNVGFVVDRIGDVVDAQMDLLGPLPVSVDNKIAAFADHILNLENDIVMLLDAKKILSHSVSTRKKRVEEDI